jgi:HEAT repeat protein
MSRRGFRYSVVLCLLVSLAGLSLVGQAQEPRYQGRTLAEWQGDLRDLSPQVRERAIEALIAFGPQAVPALTQALKDADTAVQWTAALALRRIARVTKDIVPALTRALQDRRADLGVRQRAIVTLGEIGPAAKDAVPALRKVRNTYDPSGELQKLAAEALRRIEGR